MPQDFAEQMMVKELDMLVAFLVSGEQATGDETAAADVGSNEMTAEAIIAQFGCQGCHAILGRGGEIGPSLESVGARLETAQIRQSIIEPNAVIAKGYPSGVMPPNLAEQMSDVQLDILVSFLAVRQ